MTMEELLRAQEMRLSDVQISAILDGMKKNKLYTANEENLDIRYGKLKTDFDALTTQHGESTKLIEQLKKDNAGNEALQQKISTYEDQVVQLQDQLKQTKLESAIKVALLSEKAMDVDYLTFKLKEKGELELDENEKIKGWNDKLAGLKTQFPQQFESTSSKKIDENKLPGGDNGNTSVTRDQFKGMTYEQRVALKQENEELYKQLAKERI